MAGFYLDGKFMEPRSDDTLQKLARNLEKQAAGSITRHIEPEMVFLGTDLYDSYAAKKAPLRQAGLSPSAAAQAQHLLLVLRRALEAAPAVRSRLPACALATHHTHTAAAQLACYAAGFCAAGLGGADRAVRPGVVESNRQRGPGSLGVCVRIQPAKHESAAQVLLADGLLMWTYQAVQPAECRGACCGVTRQCGSEWLVQAACSDGRATRRRLQSVGLQSPGHRQAAGMQTTLWDLCLGSFELPLSTTTTQRCRVSNPSKPLGQRHEWFWLCVTGYRGVV